MQNLKRSGNHQTSDIVCTGGAIEGGGPYEMTLGSETAYHGGWTVKGVTTNLRPVEQATKLSACWLKAECVSGSR